MGESIFPKFHHQDSKFIHGTGLQFVARHYTISVNCITLPWDRGFRMDAGGPRLMMTKNNNDNNDYDCGDEEDDDDGDEHDDGDDDDDDDDDDDVDVDIMLVTNTKEPQDHLLPRCKHLMSLGVIMGQYLGVLPPCCCDSPFWEFPFFRKKITITCQQKKTAATTN